MKFVGVGGVGLGIYAYSKVNQVNQVFCTEINVHA